MKTAKYLSRYLSLKIVMKSAMTREVNGQAITTPGVSIRFVQGLFTTEDPEVIAFLDARPELTKGIIIRVPDDVQNLLAHRAELVKSMETRDLEAELERRKKSEGEAKASVKGNGEGADVGKVAGEDGLPEMKIKALVEIARNEGVSDDVVDPFTKRGANKSELVEIIRAHRTGGEKKEPAY